MKISKKLLFVLAALFALAAVAAVDKTFAGIDLLPRWEKAGLYLGSASTKDVQNKLTNSFATSCTYDFPALAATNAASATGIQCAESWVCDAGTATTTITDTCLASSNLGADGGSALDQQASLSCRSVGNAVRFKLCWQGNDAGTYDLGDAGFTARTFSNQ